VGLPHSPRADHIFNSFLYPRGVMRSRTALPYEERTSERRRPISAVLRSLLACGHGDLLAVYRRFWQGQLPWEGTAGKWCAVCEACKGLVVQVFTVTR
jgi:hypothetical protein